DFLIDLGIEAKSEPLPKMIDRIVGAHIALSSDDAADDEIGEGAVSGGAHVGPRKPEKAGGTTENNSVPFSSPFREYYFSKEKFSH
ncbi:hypothetical protein ACI3PL_26110, partial [Lacticaseibacillus paracasei]